MKKQARGILIISSAIFAVFLVIPMVMIFKESFMGDYGFSTKFYKDIFLELELFTILKRSFAVSLGSAIITTMMAFSVAYTIHATKVSSRAKRIIKLLTMLPMFLPTITYGFAIIYAFGKNGLITKIFGGRQFFEVYGAPGIMLGYIVYTLPVAFVLINNTMSYIDKKYWVVSHVLGDKPFRSFYSTMLRPLASTLMASVVQSFSLCFTDYGIPMAVGGKYKVIATTLYNQMLGSLPDFNRGSAVAIIMLLPSVASILLLTYLERTNISYKVISDIELRKNKIRDTFWGGLSVLICLFVVGIFLTVIVVPSVQGWPYDLRLTTKHFESVFSDNELVRTYKNSLLVAGSTALIGVIFVYATGLVSVRSNLKKNSKRLMGNIALVTNTIPGMVLGIAYMLTFKKTPLQNTFILIIISTIIHYYATPLLMMKSSLEKLDPTWETTAKLMGDSWFRTVFRVVTPNVVSTLAEIFAYYFVNAMVTVSAVIFIVGAHTMLLTTKIKELEHYQQFDDIFVLSILILVTNLIVKGVTTLIIKKRKR
ncbi:MAG: ABC transporter permease subunit [Clostridia bacterium]|nr:ABC transporter permease subunit [Clostridia bacterium]